MPGVGRHAVGVACPRRTKCRSLLLRPSTEDEVPLKSAEEGGWGDDEGRQDALEW